jgi:hypothetical protein
MKRYPDADLANADWPKRTKDVDSDQPNRVVRDVDGKIIGVVPKESEVEPADDEAILRWWEVEAADEASLRWWEREVAYNPEQPRHPKGVPVGGKWRLAWHVASPEEFVRQRNQTTRPGYLSPLDPATLGDHQLFTARDGRVGFALDPDGDIQNLFNNGGPKGSGVDALFEAIDRGGKTLDAYDGYLRNLYTQAGFVETGRMHFNPDFAPDDEPDVVFMRWGGWPGGDRDGSMARAKSREGWIEGERSERYYSGAAWDQAKADSREKASYVRHSAMSIPDVRQDVPPEAAQYTPGEQKVLALVAATHGWEWALRHAHRTLEEARSVHGDDLED